MPLHIDHYPPQRERLAGENIVLHPGSLCSLYILDNILEPNTFIRRSMTIGRTRNKIIPSFLSVWQQRFTEYSVLEYRSCQRN